MFVTKTAAAQKLREATVGFDDEAEAEVGEALANYIDETYDYADGLQPITIGPRNLYAEIALAFLAGVEHVTAERQRELTRALRAADLTI